MRWVYRMLENNNRMIIYAYSRESDLADGRIIYDKENKTAKIMKPCGTDKDSVEDQEWSLEHFYKVITEGFPKERYVCIG